MLLSPIELLTVLIVVLLLWHVMRVRWARRFLATTAVVGIVAAVLVAALLFGTLRVERNRHCATPGAGVLAAPAGNIEFPRGHHRQSPTEARSRPVASTVAATGTGSADWQPKSATIVPTAVEVLAVLARDEQANATRSKTTAESAPEAECNAAPGASAISGADGDEPAENATAVEQAGSPAEASSGGEQAKRKATAAKAEEPSSGGQSGIEQSGAAVRPNGSEETPSWIGRKPFESDGSRTVYWPVTVGPLLVSNGSSAAVRNRLRQALSDDWAICLVRDLEKKTSDELRARLVAMHAAGQLSELPEQGGAWLPERLADELLAAIQQAVDQYVERYIDPRAAGHLRLPVRDAASKLVQAVWYTPWEWRKKQEQIPVATSTAPVTDTAFQVHVLLAFDDELHDMLLSQWQRWKVQTRVWRVFGVLGVVLSIIAMLYTILRIDLGTRGRYRTLLRWLGVVGIAVIVFFGLAVLV